jgi:hypothetical protein
MPPTVALGPGQPTQDDRRGIIAHWRSSTPYEFSPTRVASTRVSVSSIALPKPPVRLRPHTGRLVLGVLRPYSAELAGRVPDRGCSAIRRLTRRDAQAVAPAIVPLASNRSATRDRCYVQAICLRIHSVSRTVARLRDSNGTAARHFPPDAGNHEVARDRHRIDPLGQQQLKDHV